MIAVLEGLEPENLKGRVKEAPSSKAEEAFTLDKKIENEDILSPIMINIGQPLGVKDKLVAYSLNMDHPIGKNKAKVFKSALGYSIDDAEELAQKIQSTLPFGHVITMKDNEFGKKYTVDLEITGKNGETKTVRTAWIYEKIQNQPRMTTAFVK